MARWNRRVWILELVVYAALMLAFGALLEPGPDDRGFVAWPSRVRLIYFGGIAATYIALAVLSRLQRRRGLRARPVAIDALEALDLSSVRSREEFVTRAAPYAKAYRDTVGDLISRLVDALRWSRPDRQDFTVLVPILDRARERIRIERRIQPLVERVLEARPDSRTDTLRFEERLTLLMGLVLAPVTIFTFAGSRDSNPIARGMLFIVLAVAAPLLTRPWFSRQLLREYRAAWVLLRRNGLEHDALTVAVASEALSRQVERAD
ncbi:MAG TPA: hypothetical protein VFN91_15110 [Myxococcaceae bacterium]|nr:hypothetical protein [Myxococcaceae bacterium]